MQRPVILCCFLLNDQVVLCSMESFPPSDCISLVSQFRVICRYRLHLKIGQSWGFSLKYILLHGCVMLSRICNIIYFVLSFPHLSPTVDMTWGCRLNFEVAFLYLYSDQLSALVCSLLPCGTQVWTTGWWIECRILFVGWVKYTR